MESSTFHILVLVNLVKRYLGFLHTGSIQQLLFYVRGVQTILRFLSRASLFERSLMELDPYTLTHTLYIFTYFPLGKACRMGVHHVYFWFITLMNSSIQIFTQVVIQTKYAFAFSLHHLFSQLLSLDSLLMILNQISSFLNNMD